MILGKFQGRQHFWGGLHGTPSIIVSVFFVLGAGAWLIINLEQSNNFMGEGGHLLKLSRAPQSVGTQRSDEMTLSRPCRSHE